MAPRYRCLSLPQLHMCQGLADLYRQLGRGEDAGRMELDLAKHSDEVCGAADVALVKVGRPRMEQPVGGGWHPTADVALVKVGSPHFGVVACKGAACTSAVEACW